jgi:hypothetical protein
MDATGVYWKTVFQALEDRFECWLLNGHHLRDVPGRKTDVKDSEWTLTVALAGGAGGAGVAGVAALPFAASGFPVSPTQKRHTPAKLLRRRRPGNDEIAAKVPS